MSDNIVSQALSYYDNSKKKYKKFYKKNYVLEMEKNPNELDLPLCYFIKDGKKITKCTINILGVYFKSEKLWNWGWNLFMGTYVSSKNNTYLTRKIVNYALNINISSPLYKSKNSEDRKTYIALLTILRKELLTSNIVITHNVQLEKLLAVGLFITKSDMIYPRIHNFNENIIYYYIITFIEDQTFNED